MALYSYEAFSKDGKRVRSTIDAPSISAVKEQLSKQGLLIISIKQTSADAQIGIWQRLMGTRVSTKEVILFTKQLAVLLRSGVPLMQAFELLIEQFEGAMRTIVVQLRDHVKEGGVLADGLSRYPQTFDNVYIQLVRAGESSGKLEVILEHLTSYLQRNELTTMQIQKATRKPLNTLVLALIVVTFLLTNVVPQLAETFSEQGQKLPLPTRMMMGMSTFVIHYYLLLIVLIVGTVIGYMYWSKTISGKRAIDTIKIRLPLIKYITKTRTVVQFSYALGMLIDAGVNLPEALDIVCNIVDNTILSEALMSAKDKIVKQGKITEYLKQTNIFPPIAIYLIKTGEESSQLGSMLLMVAHNYEVELTDLIDNLIEKIDPIMTTGMSIVVGFIVMAIALPITQMGQIGNVK